MFCCVLAMIAGTGIAAVTTGVIAYRSRPIYELMKQRMRGWSGHAHKADSKLGYAPVPGASGAHVMPIGDDIPMHYDSDGFRVPTRPATPSGESATSVMALGCSFTYGDALPAEQAYPYLVGELLDARSMNAGVCGYGLSQMALLANLVVPKHKPDILLVQYSPWLIDRAINEFAPMYYGKMPGPYYSNTNTDTLTIEDPLFETAVWDLAVDNYRSTKRSAVDFVSFVFRVGIPLYVHDGWYMFWYRLRKLTHNVHLPTTNRDAVVRAAYASIARVAKASGSRMVIVGLSDGSRPLEIPRHLLPQDAIIVNAHAALLACLEKHDRDAYSREYQHWRGTPPRLVDTHPNESAHRIFAAAIAQAIQSAGDSSVHARANAHPSLCKARLVRASSH
jgi:hypothetical protein